MTDEEFETLMTHNDANQEIEYRKVKQLENIAGLLADLVNKEK